MAFIGIEVHKRETQLCVLNDDGSVAVERCFRTEPARFAEVFSRLPPGKVLLESSTESEWVARCIEELGRTVIVADPNFAPMHATRSRNVKMVQRDARTLAEAFRLGLYVEPSFLVRCQWLDPPRAGRGDGVGRMPVSS